MTDLARRAIDVWKGFEKLQMTIADKAERIPAAVMFSLKDDQNSYDQRVNKINTQLTQFIQLVRNEADPIKQGTLYQRARLAFIQLKPLFPHIFRKNVEDLDDDRVLNKLRILSRARRDIEYKIREAQDMFKELGVQEDDAIANWGLIGEMIKQRHDQARYDQLGSVISLLMDNYLEKLLGLAGIPKLPAASKPSTEIDDGAVAEMVRQQLARPVVA